MKTVSFFLVFVFFSIMSLSQNNDSIKLDRITIDEICDLIRQRVPYDSYDENDKSLAQFSIENYLEAHSGTSHYIHTPIEIAKLQKWWKDNYYNISCFGDSVWPKGGILKQIVSANFNDFAIRISGPESTYNLDLNVRDPVDGLTILDWLQQELKNPDLNSYSKKLYQWYQDFFRSKGAKTSNELNEKN